MDTGEQSQEHSEQQDEESGGLLDKAKQAAKRSYERHADDSQHSDVPGDSGTQDLDTPRARREQRSNAG